jgi:uncharacterized repeat protein (TIGR03803 family)
MRIFQLLLCCVLLAGCMHASSLPTTVPNGLGWQAQVSNFPNAANPRFTPLYNFTGLADGGTPESVLVTINGEIYGTTTWGGAHGYGGLFELSPSGTERVIDSFDSPSRELFGLVALDGNLYGLRHRDRAIPGAVVEVSTSGEERVIYRFKGSPDIGNFDGRWSGLIAVNHKLYGMSFGGGNKSRYFHSGGGCGTVFELSKSGVERVLHRFNGRSDGFAPLGTLVAFDGKLYGTTELGGNRTGFNGNGVVFEVNMSGKERVLHRFQATPDANNPAGNLVVINGKLYGASIGGGKYNNGAIFEVSLSGNERVIKSFRRKSEEGSFVTGLTVVGGKIYGTTGFGGLGDGGAIFEINTSGEVSALHYFKRYSEPTGGLVALGDKLYGATQNGGLPGCSSWPGSNCGTLFGLTL